MNSYQNIDLIKTGENIENMIRNAGYDVKYIQSYLQLSCPQPIYRWFRGQILPTFDIQSGDLRRERRLILLYVNKIIDRIYEREQYEKMLPSIS